MVLALTAISLAPPALAQATNGATSPPVWRKEHVTGTGAEAYTLAALSKNPSVTVTTRPAFRLPGTNSLRFYRPAQPARSEGGQLQPGIYETAPYTCIVVVPGPHPDDKACIGGGSADAGGPTMRVIRPDLRFIPRKK